MTEKNRRENIQEELNRAKAALGAAELLHAGGYANEAVSRLYYYLQYHVRALLLSEGLEPKSHEGALRLFSLHFVRNSLFPAQRAHVFSKLMKYREEADYNPSYSFAGEDFLQLREQAQGLAARVSAYLSENKQTWTAEAAPLQAAQHQEDRLSRGLSADDPLRRAADLFRLRHAATRRPVRKPPYLITP